MALSSSFLPSPSLILLQSPSNSKSPLLNHRLSAHRISASVFEKLPSVNRPKTHLHYTHEKIPGDTGLPFLGPFKDRLDYFYFQGRESYFNSRIDKYQSTVIRLNMPPGPFIASDPRVVALLDGKSFPVLFDTSKVEKKDLFTGTYMPDVELTGGYRVLSYLDPSEPKHAKIKEFLFYMLKSSSRRIIPEFHNSFIELFETLESELAKKGKVDFGSHNEQACFNFLARAMYETNPADTKLGNDAPKLISLWVLSQLAPLLSLGLPWFIEDPLIHTFRFPPFLVKSRYEKLYNFFNQSAGKLLNEAERMGIGREEACHNLLFATCFNTFGGFKIFFPSMMKWIGLAGPSLQRRLAEEIRAAVRAHGGNVSMTALDKMPLMKSVVYEAFRIEPPVALQYGKAKRDLVIESHDASFEVKKGEMLFGYQPFATKDPKIFENGDKFEPDRFIGGGEKLLKHVLWSNGPETESPTTQNKQCAGKDFVVLASQLFVTELFLRYDSFEMEVGKSALGVSVTINSLKKATF